MATESADGLLVWNDDIGLALKGGQVDQPQNIAKGTTDPRVEFILQDHSSQFTNLDHITISESRLSINFKISTKHQHLEPRFSTKSKVEILTKPSFRILTKIQLHNLNQTLAAKY